MHKPHISKYKQSCSVLRMWKFQVSSSLREKSETIQVGCKKTLKIK